MKKYIWSQRHSCINFLSHGGLKYKSPICGFHSKDLNPIGIDNLTIQKYQIIGVGKRNAGWSKCCSTDRDRFLYTYLYYEIELFKKPNTKILHVVPELIVMQKFLEHGFANYYCVWGGFAEGQYANYSLDLAKHIDVQNLLFDDESFDLVMCNHVLFEQKDHVRLFGKDYPSKLESCGFEIEILGLQSKYMKFGFNSKELLYIGRKN